MRIFVWTASVPEVLDTASCTKRWWWCLRRFSWNRVGKIDGGTHVSSNSNTFAQNARPEYHAACKDEYRILNTSNSRNIWYCFKKKNCLVDRQATACRPLVYPWKHLPSPHGACNGSPCLVRRRTLPQPGVFSTLRTTRREVVAVASRTPGIPL